MKPKDAVVSFVTPRRGTSVIQSVFLCGYMQYHTYLLYEYVRAQMGCLEGGFARTNSAVLTSALRAHGRLACGSCFVLTLARCGGLEGKLSILAVGSR